MKSAELKTRRLILRPVSDEELRVMRDAQEDPELYKAYGEMLESCRSDPEHRIWYAPWAIYLRGKTLTHIGDIGFHGPCAEHSVEIGYGIDEEHRSQGYATEAVKALLDWAFSAEEDLMFITAETAPDNAASQKVLTENGFLPVGIEGEEGPIYLCDRPAPSYAGSYLCIGLCIGMSLGMSVFDNISIGMCIGMLLGLALGSSLDSKVRAAQNAARREWEEKHGVVLPPLPESALHSVFKKKDT